MNVLILTPDRVGSTLLQRVITVYLLGQNIDKPVINLHELTNGIIKYYNPVTNSEVLGKPNSTDWGYFQSLPAVTELLKSTDHYKTSRLAHYHIVNRRDSINDQIKFYEYLNSEFFVISCRRDNLFEHALSWGIQGFSKRLNVYSVRDKFDSFKDIYKNKITLSKQTLENYLSKYKQYIEWSDTYFNVQSYFNYDTDIHNLEKYILNLNFMKTLPGIGWKQMFGQEFTDYNACHRLIPNLKLLPNNSNKEISFFNTPPTKDWNVMKGVSWPELPSDFESGADDLPLAIKQEIEEFYGVKVNASESEYKFLEKNVELYKETNKQMSKLIDDGFLVTGIPIKLQSLAEKKMIVDNFQECVAWYNDWVSANNFGKPYTEQELTELSVAEETVLTNPLKLQISSNN